MDPTLKALLDAHERLDATAPTDRVDVLEVLCHELPRLLELTPQEWAAKLAHIQDDLYDLGQQAERAGAIAARLATQHEQAERGLATLEAFAARRTDRDNDSAETTARVERHSDRDLVDEGRRRCIRESGARSGLNTRGRSNRDAL